MTQMAELLLGDEAVGLAAIDAGIAGIYSYPGTPATEIFEFVQDRTASNERVAARWSANEKVAYEEALGMSYAGKRSLVSMKHVGLNVAADPFINSAITGAHGALVLAVADDPGMHSSQNEQDSRFYGDFAQIPVFEPCNQQEAYDMTREAFELSERLGLPVMVRLVTRLAHSRSPVVRSEPATVSAEVRPVTESRDWTLLPINARRRFRHLLGLQEQIREFAAASGFNELFLHGAKGIIASGLAYNYVREVVGPDPTYSLLKIGVYPIPEELVRQLVDHCDEVLVVEEGYPFIEARLAGLLGMPGRAIDGKRNGTLPPDGEITADIVRTALGLAPLERPEAVDGLPGRPPALCQGCPHCDSFKAILEAVDAEEQPILFSDIGCYTLGALPPYNAVQSCVDMGSSISMALGAAKAGAHPVLCTIGDSTFTHSGMTPLLGAAHENANMTVVILDNSTVGMTGGQEVFVTGEGFLPLLKGLGVKDDQLFWMEPHQKNHDKNVDIFKRAIRHRGLTVIVACRPCIHAKRRMLDLKAELAHAQTA
ncbi:MAG: thiamine pyrophosphate-dependent enzyme [Phycisphaerae bacterium]|jgi:indolepyruvate ferredoxin oxidoreductase alpha subunit